MVFKCQKWQLLQRNQLVLLHFLWCFFGFVSIIVTADQSPLNNAANQTAELKTKLLKIIQKGKFIKKYICIDHTKSELFT